MQLLVLLRWSCAVVVLSTTVVAVTRDYYVGVVEEEWDYGPGGGDLSQYVSPQGYSQQSYWQEFLQSGQDRIGSKYLKAMYREFTDDSFSQQKPREQWMGLLGPVLAAEQGDMIRVVFKNMATRAGRTFSMHPHGLQYTKGNEGALYDDGTYGDEKADEGAGPGQQYTYLWNVTDAASPTTDDEDCLTWTYHSHIDTVSDVNSGLIGMLLTCKPGTLDTIDGKYHRRFAILANVFDENKSWYIDYNIQTYITSRSSSPDELKANADFQASNKMHGFNGRLYGHLTGLDTCAGSRTLWHLMGFGTSIDLHSISVSGNSFLVNQHRMDAIGLNPVDFVTAELEAQTVGRWRIQCSVLNHLQDGMVSFLHVQDCGYHNSSSSAMTVGNFRRFYIAIDEMDWNYAPGGPNNLFDGGSLLAPGSESEKYFRVDSQHVGGVYRKALFRQYDDVTFTTETPRKEEEEHLGFLGPVLRVEVGDSVALTLRNNAFQTFSIHPHGASVLKMWEGALYNDSSMEKVKDSRLLPDHHDDVVEPGRVRTTYWFIPDSMGPGAMDPPCITRLYSSSSRDFVRDSYSGLVGPILVCRKGALDTFGRQRQIDREFFLLLSVTDENLSWYSYDNFYHYNGDRQAEEFYSSNLMHSINGYMYGHLPGLTMCQGDRVAWHVMSVGSERDMHTLYPHGQSLTRLDTHRSSSFLLPGYFRTLLMKADNPGQWALVCQTNDHYTAGETALFNVNQCGLRRDYSVQYGGREAARNRTYFLQAEEEDWDYAPSGMDLITGRNLSDPDQHAYLFTRSDGPYLGTVYKKARYHRYTDATFTQRFPRPADEEYLGVLGPIIEAEVHDVITVVFRNAASRNYSIHAQGLFYTKNSEGAPYGSGGGSVQPGRTVVYEWSVPVDFAPAEGDPNCINQAYYSAVDPVRDTSSGLIGPIVICRPGTLDPETGARTDVDSSFVVHFQVFDETRSWYIEDNIQRFGTSISTQGPLFEKSNWMHAINGFIYGNDPRIEIDQYELVDWHLMTLGSDVDIHSAHFHGNPLVQYESGQHTKDVVQLFPGVFETVRMNATMAGRWLLHCHVHDHLTAGMETMYHVTPPPDPTTTTAHPFGDGIDSFS